MAREGFARLLLARAGYLFEMVKLNSIKEYEECANIG